MSNYPHLKAVKEKIQSRSGLNLDDIKVVAPSAFTEGISADTRKYLKITDKYVHIPTSRVIEDVQNLGWIPISAEQAKANSSRRNGYQRHLVKFINPDLVSPNQEEHPELLLMNSHDGASSFRFEIGFFRLVCSNGLVVKSNDMGSLRIRHMWYDLDTLQSTIEGMVAKVPDYVGKVSHMKEINMSQDDMNEFAIQSALMRFKNQNESNIGDIVDLDQLLGSKRKEDNQNNLWNVFNRVQEKIINGGFSYNMGDKQRKARVIKGLQTRVKINQDLWELTDQWA